MAGYTAFADLEIGSSVRSKINTQFTELFGENAKTFITTANATARLAIPAAYLYAGKLAYQLDTLTVYEFVTGSTWKIWVPAGSQLYGECYLYGNTTAMAIDIVNAYHACPNGLEGMNNGFTYKNGKVAAVTSVASASGGSKITCTSNAHEFLDGEIITINNSTNYDGVYVVESASQNTFVVTKTYVATRAFNAARGFSLKAATNTTGTFIVDWNCTLKPAANNKTITIELNKNVLPEDKSAVTQLLASTTDLQNMAAGCIITVSAGDYLWVSVKNHTDAIDITIVNANLRIRRI
jgi:hypothetical protein